MMKFFKPKETKELKDIIKELGVSTVGQVSDGYHTFDELYYHRTVLFAIICNHNRALAWKSKLHNDGTMYEDMFIAGISTPEGQYTYHIQNEYWDLFNVNERNKAPEWDGHKPEDITRLLSLPAKTK